MKNPFLKSAVVLGVALALVCCSEESTNTNIYDPNATADSPVAPEDPAWLFHADQDFLIYPIGVVTDLNGNVVAQFVMDETTGVGAIVGYDGSVIVDGINPNALQPTSLAELMNGSALPESASSIPGSYATQPQQGNNNNTATGSSASQQDNPQNNPQNPQTQSSPSTASASSAAPQVVKDGSLTITGGLTQTVAKNGQTNEVKFTGVESVTRMSWNAWWLTEPEQSGDSYTIPASTVPEYFQPDNGNTVSEFFKVNGKDYEFQITIGSGSAQQQQQQQPNTSTSTTKSSASQQQPKSSASVQPKSSSSKSNVNLTGDEAKYVDAGKGGKPGFATRYWDCCKPHCAWSEHGTAKTCNASGTPVGSGTTSMCDGGDAGICKGQTPIIVSDQLAYAFAAAPAAIGGQCGKCFALTFTGKGKYETKLNHEKLLGKTLVIMISNIGGDVDKDGGQFDIMIPGGGVGLFNGCQKMGWGEMGKQYGGLLSACEDEVGYSGNKQDIYEKRKSCLTDKCGKTFANDAAAKEGCLFLATWMEAAGNPKTEYKEVECPSALKNAY